MNFKTKSFKSFIIAGTILSLNTVPITSVIANDLDINSIKTSSDASEKKDLINEKLTTISADIKKTSDEITSIQTYLDNQAKQAQLKKDDSNLLSIILSSKNLSEIILKKNNVNKIYETVKNKKQELEQSKKQLEAQLLESQNLSDQLQTLQNQFLASEKQMALENYEKSIKSDNNKSVVDSIELYQSAPVSTGSYSVGNFGSSNNTYAWGNCTYYVKSFFNNRIGDFWGNASSWTYAASAAGAVVDSTPVPFSTVAAFAPYQTGAGGYGHVALVIAVTDTTVTVREMNAQGLNVISDRVIPISGASYIHV